MHVSSKLHSCGVSGVFVSINQLGKNNIRAVQPESSKFASLSFDKGPNSYQPKYSSTRTRVSNKGPENLKT